MSDDILLEVKTGNLDGLKRLIAGGIEINSKGQFGWTVLHLAIYDSHPEIVSWILAQKPDVNIQAEDGSTALHYAASYNDEKLVKCLIVEHKADVDIKNNRGQTPLAMAIQQRESEEIIRVLKKYGGKTWLLPK